MLGMQLPSAGLWGTNSGTNTSLPSTHHLACNTST